MSSRPSLPASSSDFALPSATSTSHVLSSAFPLPSPAEENAPLMFRFRRPSLLVPTRTNSFPEGHLQSPLAMSFTLPLSRRYSTSIVMDNADESEGEKDNKMWTDSPSSMDSGTTTPSLSEPSTFSDKSTLSVDSDGNMKVSRPRSPSTPPPKQSSKTGGDTSSSQDVVPSQVKMKRLSQPVSDFNLPIFQDRRFEINSLQVRLPRILSLVQESHPEENEVKSEAQFQRLVASGSDLPTHPRTPRAPSDRGRYPEEADTEEHGREETPSDDEEDESVTFAYIASEPINIVKPVTPAQSVAGDDYGFSESPGGVAMDIDLPSSSYGSPNMNMNSWRYTPPPTTSAVRSNKRKFDDRYDPYPTANKRRAVSPSLSYLRESQPSLFTPRTPNGSARVPLPLPISIPNGLNSGASSPIISSNSGLTSTRPLSIGTASAMSSPTLRATIGLSSPILRPMIRARREGEGREVDGAGEAVNGLSLE
ncbi:hypothetical protein C8Q75DRAFT_337628 [Abortiporus biennis]|nr:hypothetical protein C8Q75DRAFT_337628 [Abortiporus biennis]